MARQGRPERNRAAQSFRQLRRFHHIINSDEVFRTHSGTGPTKRIHILVKPTRPELISNLVINTDRRTYLLELRSAEKT